MSLKTAITEPKATRDTLTAVETSPIDVTLLDVTVVLPCLDEEASVAACVAEAAGAILQAGWTGEVLVVDNGSLDRSVAVATSAGARVVVESQRGYGAALRRGIAEARGSIVVMADADCTYPLSQLHQIVQPVRDGTADIMIGSRLDSATRRSMPLLHRFVGTPTLTWLVREGTGATGLSDSQSGFRAFRSDIVDRLGLRATGMEFASEMLIRAAQRNLNVAEIPLGYRDRLGESKLSTWSDGMRHLRLIIRLSPHLLLWKPGLALMALGVMTYLLGFVSPAGTGVGTFTWDPVFFATILVVLGLLGSLSGALLARHSPSASLRTRQRFAWVDQPRFLIGGPRLGVALVAIGVILEGLLFIAWVSHTTLSQSLRMHLAGIAQGLLLTGTILAAVVAMYRLIAHENTRTAPEPDSPRG